MNILYFTRTMGVGGTEKVIIQLCKSLYSQFDNIIVCSCGGCNVEVLNKLGIKHYEIVDIEDKRPLTILKNLCRLAKLIKKEKINIIHTHHRMAALYTKFLNYFYKFKFIHTAHNTFNDKVNLTRYALDGSKIIAVGKNVKKNLVEQFKIKEKNITVIYNSIEEEDILYEDIHQIYKLKQEGNFIVGNIGRLSKQKGMKYFIEAANEIIKTHNKIRFFIIGDGEERETLKKLIEKYNLNEYIVMLGYRSDIGNIIRQLDVLVLSSLWEGLPLTPIEAFSLGKTVIATEVDGTPEIIKNGYNGILIKPKNHIEIAKNIIYLYENREILVSLEKCAKQTYINRFSYNVFVKQYKEFYNNEIKEESNEIIIHS